MLVSFKNLSRSTVSVVASVLLASCLTGCATYRTHEARAVNGTLIGANILDLMQAAGIPDKMIKVVNTGGPTDRMIVQWNFSNADSALDVTVVVLELKVGGAGKCSMTASVDRWGGKITAINFPQAHRDSWGSSYGACEPLVTEALNHMPHTQVDPQYDAFNLIGAAK